MGKGAIAGGEKGRPFLDSGLLRAFALSQPWGGWATLVSHAGGYLKATTDGREGNAKRCSRHLKQYQHDFTKPSQMVNYKRESNYRRSLIAASYAK